MKRLPLMRALFFLLVGFVVLTTARAQTSTDPNEGSRLTYDSVIGRYAFSWWGQPGRTYFIQHSDELTAWEYLPVIESGTNKVLSWGIISSLQLPKVCREWEAATAPAEAAGIRTVHLRTGIVLSASGGALGRMLTPFKLGLGGRIASGRQYMSWIALDDEVGGILHALDHAEVEGVINATAPSPATNSEFTAALGTALHRPTLLPTPLLPVKALYGKELVQRLLVDGQRVLPTRLEMTGYQFRYPTLEAALRAIV